MYIVIIFKIIIIFIIIFTYKYLHLKIFGNQNLTHDFWITVCFWGFFFLQKGTNVYILPLRKYLYCSEVRGTILTGTILQVVRVKQEKLTLWLVHTVWGINYQTWRRKRAISRVGDLYRVNQNGYYSILQRHAITSGMHLVGQGFIL